MYTIVEILDNFSKTSICSMCLFLVVLQTVRPLDIRVVHHDRNYTPRYEHA